MAQIVTVTDANFDEVVLHSSKPVLVDFWAVWCGPCKQMAPVLDQIAAEHPEMVVAKIDVDQHPATPAKYGVRGIPTLILFKDGKAQMSKVGAMSKTQLEQALSPALA